MTTEHGIFEVAPPEDVDGRPTSLVYTRAREAPLDLDYRHAALRLAIDAETSRAVAGIQLYNYHESDSDMTARSLISQVLSTAEIFESFLRGE